MKKIYRILLTISTICLLYTLTIFLKETIDFVIPGVKTTITVDSWDKRESTTVVFDSIKKYAQKHQVEIHKINFSTNNNGRIEKNIFTFSKNKTSNFSYDSSSFPTKTNFYDSSCLRNENVLGMYVLTSKPPESIIDDFSTMGISITVEKTSTVKLLMSVLMSNLGLLTSILFLSTGLSMIFYQLAQAKRFGVFEIHGQSTRKDLLRNYIIDLILVAAVSGVFLMKYPILLVYYIIVFGGLTSYLFLITILGNIIAQKASTLVEKIKGKKPYNILIGINYLLKFIVIFLFVYLLFFVSSEIKELKELESGLSRWTKVSGYYTLTIGADSNLLPRKPVSSKQQKINSITNNRRLKPLIDFLEAQEAIFVNNNEWLLKENSGGSNLYLDKVPFLIVNNHFFETVDVKDDKYQKIKNLSSKENYLLIPENKKAELNTIKQESVERIAFYQNKDLEMSTNIEVNTKFLAKNQKIFNFNILEPQYTISEDPIILVLSIEQLGSELDILISEISQGHYLFKNEKLVAQEIINRKLANEFSGIIAAEDTALEILKKNQSELKTLSLSLLVLFFVFMVIIFYTSLTYLEVNKKKLLLQYIFGVAFFKRHGSYLLGMLLISFVAMMLFAMTNLQTFIIVPFVLMTELIFLSIIIIVVERTIRLTTIKKEN
jgi:putative ABC transport system permease protein